MNDIRGGVNANGRSSSLSDFTSMVVPGVILHNSHPATGRGIRSRHPEAGGSQDGSRDSWDQRLPKETRGRFYAIPNGRIVTKTMPLINNYFKTGPLRAGL